MSKIKSESIDDAIFVPAVVCFPVKGNKVLLIHRKKTSGGLGQDLISGIGGKIGDLEKFAKETTVEALKRECLEEIEIVPTKFQNKGRVRFYWKTKPEWNMEVEIFVATEWNGVPKETEVAKPVWHEINELPKNQMWEDNLYWVPKVLAGKIIDAVFFYGSGGNIEDIVYK